jgi:deoxyribonuclease-4
MAILGAHMSIAGGYHKAVDAALENKCDCVQLFTKNNNQWRAKPITDDDVRRFRTALDEHKITHPLSHSSYLINLASPDKVVRKRSLDSLVVELQRAELLGIPYVVLHPGAYTTGTEASGLRLIIRALDQVHRQTSGSAN